MSAAIHPTVYGETFSTDLEDVEMDNLSHLVFIPIFWTASVVALLAIPCQFSRTRPVAVLVRNMALHRHSCVGGSTWYPKFEVHVSRSPLGKLTNFS